MFLPVRNNLQHHSRDELYGGGFSAGKKPDWKRGRPMLRSPLVVLRPFLVGNWYVVQPRRQCILGAILSKSRELEIFTRYDLDPNRLMG